MKHLRCSIFIWLCQIHAILALTCVNEAGKPVDWYILYKFPQMKNSNPLVSNGTAYAFLGPDDSVWNLSEKSIDLKSISLGLTLNPIYTNPKTQDNFYIFYNDENPRGPVSFSHGHTKGVVAFDGNFGLWLVHSVPKYPPHLNDSYSYPASGERYGQSFLCISINISQASNLSNLLYYNDPDVYDFHLPDAIAEKFPLFNAITKGKHVQQAPWNVTSTLSSRNNFPFQAFAKFKKFNRDIYSSWMAPYLTSNLYTETWQNGPSKLPSNCSSEYVVENIKQMSFSSFDVVFDSTLDHSKLAISDGPNAWTCIGDINRMSSQKRRGGGSVCLKSSVVWKNFINLVTEVEKCNCSDRS